MSKSIPTSRSSRSVSAAVHAGTGAVVASLCLLLASSQGYALGYSPGYAPGYSLGPAASNVPATKTKAPLSQAEKVQHALNRFTFGARPGEEAAVRKMGLDAWFQRQLHPEGINDAALTAQLTKFPALQLSQDELIRRFPSPQIIRAASGVKNNPAIARYVATEMPTDPVQHAIYADAIYAYRMGPKGQGAAAKKAVAAAGAMPAPNGEQAGDIAGKPGMAAQAPADKDSMAPAMEGKGNGKKKQVLEAAGPPMSDTDVQALLALPADQRYDRMIAMSPQEMLSLRTGLRPVQRLFLLRGMTPAQTEVTTALTGQANRVVGTEALEARLLRDVDSDRQLQAVMTDFWLNHFNVYARKSETEPYYLNSYERDTILPNALGKFENLLVATAESPAMLTYLDNFQSVGPDSPAAERGKRVQTFADSNPNRPGLGLAAQLTPKGINENYARELMELHTLGARCEVSADHPASQLDASCGKGYTQADVTNVAKVLTGWTIERPYQGGKMTFDEQRHEPGSKTVLGATIPEAGSAEGMQVLHMLATSPATAHFISYKLAVRFVADNPPDALVDRMAGTFLKTDGDIKAVLTTLFHSPEFWAPDVYRAKIKTPIEFVASALRASDATINNALPLVQAMDKLGMPIYGMQTPNGYSWAHDNWVSSNALISRMNFALVLSGDLLPGTRTDWPQLLGQSATSGDVTVSAAPPSPETERKLELLLLGQPAAERTRATVLQEAQNPTAQHAAQQSFAVANVQDEALGDDTTEFARLGRKPGRRQNGGGLQTDRPEAPLNTMAGLLLGSPEFQRR